ncbi:PF07377 family protein [Leptospira interrogans serovar Bataviae str. HAI135]|nr:PF07377 family protein [Leptospira interrogans serovar Bataviae str. HAI135]
MNLNNQEKFDILRISKKIFICVVRHTGQNLDKLSLKTCIVKDLGISGDDTDDLLQDINRYFQIDWSSLNFEKNFGKEGFSIVEFLFFNSFCFEFGFQFNKNNFASFDKLQFFSFKLFQK